MRRLQPAVAQAEPLYQRALAIWEKALGAAYPSVVTVLGNYALLLREMKRGAAARELEVRARRIRAAHAHRSVRGFDPEATLPIGYQVEANYAANPISEIPAGQFPVTGGVLFAGVGGQPRTLFPADTHDFMPRVGFAYHPLKNTVMRAGYGIMSSITSHFRVWA